MTPLCSFFSTEPEVRQSYHGNTVAFHRTTDIMDSKELIFSRVQSHAGNVRFGATPVGIIVKLLAHALIHNSIRLKAQNLPYILLKYIT